MIRRQKGSLTRCQKRGRSAAVAEVFETEIWKGSKANGGIVDSISVLSE